MATIRQYTTFNKPIRAKGISLIDFDVWVTFSQRNKELFTLSGDEITMSRDGDDTLIAVFLTQEMTALLCSDRQVEIQVNWMVDGQRHGSRIKSIKTDRNLLKRALP